MKRELAFVLESQTQLCRSLGRTRSSRIRDSESNGFSETFTRKRFKGSGVEFGFPVSDCNGVSENEKEIRFSTTSPLKLGLSNDNAAEGLVLEECVLREAPGCDSENPICKEEPGCESREQPVVEVGSVEKAVVLFDGRKEETPLVDKQVRRFTRSALKPKEEDPMVEDSVLSNGCLGDFSKNVEVVNYNEDNVAEVKPSISPKKNLELKMSKKISLYKVPSNLRELLETGLLEGLQVAYNLTGSKGPGLRGIIKGVGILCFCDSCKGCSVVSPSQFERHACKVYRNAAKYICLENGSSFAEVIMACKDSSLDTLHTTIHNALGSLSDKRHSTCHDWTGSSPASCTSEKGPAGNSCMDLEKPQAESPFTIKKRARSLEPVLTFKSSECASLSVPLKSKVHWKITKKNQGLHKLVFEEGGLPDGTELAYYAKGQKLLEGYKRGSGIFCLCCHSEVSASLFEIHAGWASRKKPYHNIYTSNGVSLHELSVSLAKGRKCSARDNDDLCIICADGGNLLLCDGCPRAFHKECASLSCIPRGNWYCEYCQNMFHKEKFVNANALAAGRVTGVDPIEEITKRCIRIVRNPETGVGGCVLCRSNDFHKSGFGPRTVILCDQCEKEFHVGCLKDHKMADLKELPTGKWFCCMDCRRIDSTLQKLVGRGAEKLPEALVTVLKKRHEERGLDATEIDVRWRLLSGKVASPETRLLLSQAVAIFHDCFDPIVDSTTGRDLIPSMVYGRNIRDQEFGGMYCAILTVNSTVVSTGILRIFGREVAELPLVATIKDNHGKGYFQTLFSCIERLLAFLKVKSFVLPAADEAKSIWTEKFGFRKISLDQLSKYRKSCSQMMKFQGTSMLQKTVPECRVVRKSIE